MEKEELDEQARKAIDELTELFISVLRLPEYVTNLLSLLQQDERNGVSQEEWNKTIAKSEAEFLQKYPEFMKSITQILGDYFHILTSYSDYRTLEKQSEAMVEQAKLIEEQTKTADKLLKQNRILSGATVALAVITAISVIIGAIFHL